MIRSKEAVLHLGGRALEHPERADDRLGHPVPGAANLEVLEGPLGLGPPVPGSGQHRGAQLPLAGRSSAALRAGMMWQSNIGIGSHHHQGCCALSSLVRWYIEGPEGVTLQASRDDAPHENCDRRG